jgi:hypothetical protein
MVRRSSAASGSPVLGTVLNYLPDSGTAFLWQVVIALSVGPVVSLSEHSPVLAPHRVTVSISPECPRHGLANIPAVPESSQLIHPRLLLDQNTNFGLNFHRRRRRLPIHVQAVDGAVSSAPMTGQP